jgi:phosphoribosylamine-glycine ligase
MDDENQIKTWITLDFGGEGGSIAYHLKQEGEKSIFGKVQDKSETKAPDDEEPDEKKERLAQYDGMVDKYPARKLINALKKIKNKDEYFIFCAFNNMWPFAEELLAAGFKQGMFPLKKDFDFEKGREDAMNFVEEHYPDIKIIPHQKVATVEEARKIVEESDVPLVIQSEGDFVSTIVGSDDVEQSKELILAALDEHEKEYAKGEILLKEKLVQPVEITPQIVFYNGEPVFTDVDIETKNIGDGENNGNQVGCGSNLIIRTELDDEINRIAFPPKVYEMAKEHTGIFVWDISIYFTDTGMYFGEFCSNRFGYDAIYTEMAMAGGAGNYFKAIVNGENPLKKTFGVGVRAFNLKKSKEQEMDMEKWENVWVYSVKDKDGKTVSTNDSWDLAVLTGAADTIEEAVDEAYDNMSDYMFKEKYYRSQRDFLADFPTSIIHRLNAMNGIYFSVPDLKEKEVAYEEKLAKVEKGYKDKVEGFKKQLKDLMYGTNT